MTDIIDLEIHSCEVVDMHYGDDTAFLLFKPINGCLITEDLVIDLNKFLNKKGMEETYVDIIDDNTLIEIGFYRFDQTGLLIELLNIYDPIKDSWFGHKDTEYDY